MIKALFTVFIFLTSSVSFSQNGFPDSWVGNYAGQLEIYGKKGVNMTANMRLEIHPKTDSLYTWHLIYEMNGNEDRRMYELKVIDQEKGHYVVDEKNSIILDNYYHLDRFTSIFEVMGSFIVIAYTKEGEDLIFEMIAGNSKNPRVSGTEIHEGKEMPEVKAYPVTGRQRAVLKKVD